jgi:hypothetical protein
VRLADRAARDRYGSFSEYDLKSRIGKGSVAETWLQDRNCASPLRLHCAEVGVGHEIPALHGLGDLQIGALR